MQQKPKEGKIFGNVFRALKVCFNKRVSIKIQGVSENIIYSLWIDYLEIKFPRNKKNTQIKWS